MYESTKHQTPNTATHFISCSATRKKKKQMNNKIHSTENKGNFSFMFPFYFPKFNILNEYKDLFAGK